MLPWPAKLLEGDASTCCWAGIRGRRTGAQGPLPAQVGVLQWFARLWEIDQDDYWGYITNCGTEGNLHGILVGRENLPDGILYASHETHYSVFKAARMYRMDSMKVRPARAAAWYW